jgi:hypothetical protein
MSRFDSILSHFPPCISPRTLIALKKSSLTFLRGLNMDIRIKKITTPTIKDHPDLPDSTGVYLVIDNGKEFTITCRFHIHGNSLCLYGQEGTLHTDTEAGKVYRQVVAPGGGCGLIITDEPVEGLSPWALRGIIIAEQSREEGEILITSKGVKNEAEELPVMFIDGKAADLHK